MFGWNPDETPFENAARLGALELARDAERRRREREMADPMGDPETAGRSLLGRYIRRSRRLAGLTQQQLADKAGVSQSMVSRAERGLAPAMATVRLVRMVQPLARFFPFGVCPHDHNCSWQPVKPPDEPVGDDVSGIARYFLGSEIEAALQRADAA
jgi:transcriptional regulator with XRE-family HTH domain